MIIILLTLVVLYIIGLSYAHGSYEEMRDCKVKIYKDNAIYYSVIIFLLSPLTVPLRIGYILSEVRGNILDEEEIEEDKDTIHVNLN